MEIHLPHVEYVRVSKTEVANVYVHFQEVRRFARVTEEVQTSRREYVCPTSIAFPTCLRVGNLPASSQITA
jgi:hypothetical protein